MKDNSHIIVVDYVTITDTETGEVLVKKRGIEAKPLNGPKKEDGK